MEPVGSGLEPIAIIGTSCRLPGGANSPAELWQILEAGHDAVSEVPASRWDRAAWYDPDVEAPGKMYTTRGGFMDVAVDQFDAPFFGISPKEAASMDPQQRILLELAWEALEDAAVRPEALRGGDAGVFIGVSSTDYADMCIHDNLSQATSYALTGNCHSALAGRISYVFGLEGPSMSIDTACSSSLVAIDNACAYLRLGKTSVALAGGFNLMLSPDMQVCLTRLQALSPDGQCRSFDATANGYARSEGGALVVLKRLRDALADGDRILGLIRGSYVNQDGRSTGISAPNGASQERVILSALREAGLTAADLDYIEAHGTGTRVGDKTEITAIGEVMRSARQGVAPLLVGSVKSNVGHLEAASGIAGLLKVLLSLQHETIPANLHFVTPNPTIRWDDYPLRIVDRHQPWPRGERTRRAGVSSFGFVGTNSHLIVEEPPLPVVAEAPEADVHRTLPVSARTPASLRALIRRYQAWLREHADDARMVDLCYTASVSRQHFEYRAAVCGRDFAALDAGLAELLEDDAFPRSRKDTRVVFLFTGQGAQYPGMGRELYRTQPAFRQALDRCDRVYHEVEGASLIELMHGRDADPQQVHDTRWTQPLLFSLEVALAHMWMSWGVRPAACVGHSIGEYAAACVAGVLTIEDALRLVVVRGRLMGAAPGRGLMASVSASLDEVAVLVNGRVTIAAHNAPASVVIGGFEDAVRPVLEQLEASGVAHQLLSVSHAFHSPQMDPVLDPFREAFAGITLRNPEIPVISNLTARPVGAGEMTSPDYWVRHLRNPVRMSESLTWLGAEGYGIFLELGPKPVLLGFARECLGDARSVLVGSMKPRVPESRTVAEALGELYRAGVDADWAACLGGCDARRIALPTYAFSGARHWIESSTRPVAAVSVDDEGHTLLGRRFSSAALPDTVVFEMDLARRAHYFFAEHVILGVETAPGAALLSLVWQAAVELFGGQRCCLADITFVQPLIGDDDDRVGQIIVRDVNAMQCGFELVSRETDGEGAWTTHCKGRIERGGDAPVVPAPTEPASGIHLSGDEFYAVMEALGYHYGPLFRGISDVRAPRSAQEGVCSWRSAARDARTEGYAITPHDLDIVFQSPAIGLLEDATAPRDSEQIHVPFYIKRLHVLRPLGPGDYRTHCRTGTVDARAVESAMEVRSDRGELCVVVEGFVATAISRQALLRAVDLRNLTRRVYDETWKPQALAEAAPASKTWVLLGDGDAACAQVAERLSAHGPVHVLPFDGLERTESYVAALAGLEGDLGVVHMRRLHEHESLEANVERMLRSVLHLTQAMLGRRHSRLYVVTSGACEAPNPEGAPSFGSVGVEGFVAVSQWEHAELRVTQIDLPAAIDDESLARLTDELLADSPETRVCLRRGHRWVARLGRWRPHGGRALAAPSGPFTLDTGDAAALDDFALVPMQRRAPGPDEVEFEIVAAGLNFKDVLRALGELPDSANRIGGESAGVVTRVGADVPDLAIGDAVISRDMAGGAFSSHQTAPRRFVCKKPDGLTFAEAATIPIPFMTAWYGLLELARLQSGERVLIHAGAGGVGMAAVQLALHVGAEVFCTAGSDAKRRLLADLGVAHVYDSRTGAFAEQIMRDTGGRGIDVVLNSLTGDALRGSLRVMGPGGRFIELGKREILSRDEVATINPSVVYHAFDLTDVVGESPTGRQDMLDAIFTLMDKGEIRPLPVRVFAMEDAPRAFRFMSQARHVGRVALSVGIRGHDVLRGDGAYLVTGGLGALGLEAAARMAAHPVGSIVLVGRGAPSAEALARVDAWRASGVHVEIARCDVADKADCDHLFALVDGLTHPLRGVIHAAGVLRDRTIQQQDWDQFVPVLAPKVQGAWNLHEATRSRRLDFFVMFSSAASTIGNGGQANYAAANSFMNALARYRRAVGLCATSICWGPWAQVGMAASDRRAGERMAEVGMRGIEPTRGIDALFEAIEENLEAPTVLEMDWPRFIPTVPEHWADTYLQDLRGRRSAPASTAEDTQEQAEGGPLQRLREAAEAERGSVALGFLRKAIGRVTGQDDAEQVPVDASLTRLGLDSLMVMSFRNQVEKKLAIDLPMTVVPPHSTLEDIAIYVVGEVFRGSGSA